MDHVIYTALNGARHALEHQAVITNNLANVSTHGFKAQLAATRFVPIESTVGHQTRTLAMTSTPATGGLQDTTKTLSTITSQLGLQLKEVENLNSRHEETSVLLKERQSQLMDTNLLEEITEFKQLEEVMQASYSIYGQMKDLSLFKILR